MADSFEAEYENVRELSIEGVNLLHEVRENMENQMDRMNESKTLYEFTSRKDEFEEMTDQVSSGHRTLAGTQKYLMTDFTPAMRSLQETLAKYSKLLQDRLKKEMVTYKITDAKVKGATSVELVGMRSQAESQKQLTDLAKALKELEKQVAECDQTLRDLTLLTNEALQKARQIEEDLRKAQAEADRKRRKAEEKMREEEGKKENERREKEEDEERKRRQEEEERLRKEEEERLRLEAERLAKLSEEERLREEEEKRLKREEEERLRIEEEERLRREEEERLRLEEEERLRLEEEERLRLEEEERLRLEEEERLRIEEEERLRLEEEERLRLEEEERLRLEEEERLRLEEEERLRLEEEERLRKEEEERLKREEEERLRLEEEERLRLEEEERLRLEEEERLRREEEERLKREEEDRKKKDPRCWENVIVYKLRDEVDAVGYGVACIIRAPEDVVLKQDDIDCTVIDMTVHRYPLSEHEELVSNLINLRPSNGAELTFENDVWLALPYPQGQRSREMKIRIQKLSAEGDAADNVWEDAETHETTIQGQEPITKYVHTRLRHLPAEGMNITVITRLRKDSQQFNNKGGKLVSSVDHRVAVQVPRNAFRLTVEISLQIILVDSSALSELKGRYDGCENILGSSPIVCLGCGHSPQQPLNFFITNPFGGRLKRPVTVAAEVKAEGKGKKESNLPRVSNVNVNGSDAFGSTETEIVVLLTKDVNGRWRIRQEVVLNFERDSTHFGLKELAERFLLLRISQKMEPSLLSRIARDLENSLKERPATIIVRQDVDDNATMYVEVCKSDNINKVIQKLKNDKFTDGPATQVTCLREGDVIEVSFSPTGNIDFDDRTPRRFTFNSNLASSKLTTEIKERDVYAQKASETYKGHLRISLVDRDYEPPPKLLQVKGDQRDVDKKQIAELLLSLPKLPKEFAKVNRIPFPIPNRGPLTEEYFNHLTDELGDEWFIVADRLEITKEAIQRITACYADLGTSDATDKSIKHMLTDWFKTSSTSNDKVEDLQMALMEAGRNDLAEELAAKNKEFRQEMEERLEETNLRKITQAFCASQAAVKSWKKVAKALGLNQNDILAIQGEDAETVTTEMVETMLKRWRENNGRSANKDSLVVCLQNLKLTEAASRVGLVR